MRPTERAAIQQLGTLLFAPFGDYQEALHRWLRSPGVLTSVVNHSKEGLVGFGLVGLIQSEGGTSQAYLLGIGVVTHRQRQGLGRRLLDSLLVEARKRRHRWGVQDLRLEVASGNTSARLLFERAGFHPVPASQPSRVYATGETAMTLSIPLVAEEQPVAEPGTQTRSP